jgi:hypothetical protein
MKRRTFIKDTCLAAGMFGISGTITGSLSANPVSEEEPLPEVKQLTSGNKQHWFGYYDKFQIDPSGRYALGGQVETFFRSPTVDDILRIGIIDLENSNEWREIGTSASWGWQQSCMLQWVPGSDREVIWNNREETGLVSHIYNIETGKTRTLPRPVYTLSPDGKFGLSLDFERLQFFRPGYGYPVRNMRNDWEKAPQNQGIYKIDIRTGKSELIVSNAQVATLPRERGSVADYYHWFNHLLISPDGSRFFFLDRSRPVLRESDVPDYLKTHPEVKASGFDYAFVTRALTANTDGGDIYTLNDEGTFSHFIWKGNGAISAWAAPDEGGPSAFYVFRDKSKRYEQAGKGIMVRNGHISYVPNTNYEWILNDTYPVGKERFQELFLFHVPTGRKIILGKFHEPSDFKGEWRCDLHPRCDQQGKRVFFDSTHEGGRRQIYMIDISEILKS